MRWPVGGGAFLEPFGHQAQNVEKKIPQVPHPTQANPDAT